MSRTPSKVVWFWLAASLLLPVRALCLPVPDLYVTEVPAAGLTGPALDDAFELALRGVLVKVTGRRTLAGDSAAGNVLANPGSLVRQYQPLAGGRLRVRFDSVALRRRLDAANLPVWSDDRPKTLVVLPSEAAAVAQADAITPSSTRRQVVMDTAVARGVPIALAPALDFGAAGRPDPLRDSDAVLQAAGAAVLLVAEPVASAGALNYRWTLVNDGQRAQWQGDAADGVHGLADRLASIYGSVASTSRELSLRIDGITNFDAYGRLQAYLRSVGLIQRAFLSRISGSSLIFAIEVRGDRQQLDAALSQQRVLEPVPGSNGDELVYRLAITP